MNISEVPQDDSSLTSKKLKELCYATDKDGNYITALSKGWEVKTVALNNSLELIEERVEESKKRCLEGEISPIQYYMEFNRMDLTVLSSYMGKWQWQLKRHFKPKIFNKLPLNILQKYANTFNITIEELKEKNL